MSARLATVGLGLLCALGLVASCRFQPDLSRFEPCAEDDTCPLGYTCLAEAHRCLPDCGAQGPCPVESPPEPSPDAGPDEDGGTDAGLDAGPDAGPPLTLVTETLAPAVEALPYTMALEADGGTAPYGFRATETLPEWLTLDGGILSGTPPTPGSFRVAVEVSDSDTPPATRSAAYDLRVRPQLRVAGPGTLVDGYPNKFYSERLSATGGKPPYSFKLLDGGFPGDLTLLQDGSVTGTPSATGTYSFRVQVTDSDDAQPQTAVRPLALGVVSSPLGLTISNQSVPDARVGTPYQYVLRISSNSNVTWTLKAGSLPDGIGFHTDTATLSGTPNASGSWTFTVSVTDGLLGTAEKSFTLTVY
ncbi:MAG: Ig domain-containing protein [Hyalangium sp.]|uniref:Ig domain-containing protein n=1 Tax=Hyalangium sp. TaxID=2028555 RepID=UPI003899A9C0